MIFGLGKAREAGAKNVHVKGDFQSVIGHMRGTSRVRSDSVKQLHSQV